MRIAQVSPLFESTPPKTYGGTERIASYLTEELVKRGHEVTLFASGDSVTKARLIAGCPDALRLHSYKMDCTALHVLQLKDVYDRMDEFDLIHFHTDYLHFPATWLSKKPNVTTLHGRLDIVGLDRMLRAFDFMPLVSISNAQRKPVPFANWTETVYHGLPPEDFRCYRKPGSYLAFLGRICAEKGIERAIEIARRCAMPLKIAAKVDPVDAEYYHQIVKPLLKTRDVEYIGEIGQHQKNEFLGNAAALLFPIDWPEPFGLVMIEALASGTPVIAFNRGSVPEIMRHGQNGFIVSSVAEAVEAVQKISTVSRRACHEDFLQRFTVTSMVDQYEDLYRRLIEDDESYHLMSDYLTINEHQRIDAASTGTYLGL